jgi:hypothetical protein
MRAKLWFDRRCGWLAIAACLAGSCGGVRAATPGIELTNVPAFGSLADLGGRVLNVAPAGYRVAVFIFVPGAGWWSKPFCNPQLTVIGANGSWTADITTGGSDQYATKICALLVDTGYNQACVQGAAALPAAVTNLAYAGATVTRQDTRLRWVSFGGYDWWVKSSVGFVGPGPNYFSDSTNNVWLDGQGQLHLKITNRSNAWQCAELVSARTFGYGHYRFELASSVDALDKNAVLGLFTWSDDAAYAHREIDVEGSRWGNAGDPNDAQYVVQPFDTAGHLVRYRVAPGVAHSTHLFTWETNRIRFAAQVGSYATNPPAANVISNWTYALDVPPSGDENVRLNLWLYGGAAPAGGQPVEFVVKSFQFVPLGAPTAAVLTNFHRETVGQAGFDILGATDWHYQVLASSNLLDWQELATVTATNGVTRYSDGASAGTRRRYYRAATLP